MNFLKTFTLSVQQSDTFSVYWTNSASRFGGVVHVKVTAKLDDRAIAAELAAIQHLLEVKKVLGNNLSGNAKTKLVVSSGAIRKLHRQQSDKGHLAPYANFLCTRFAACPVSVEKDTSWFSGQIPSSEDHLLVSAPLRAKIQLHGLGEVTVTRHVLQRFVDRVIVDQAADQAIQVAWKKLNKLADHPSVKEVTRKSLWSGIKNSRFGKQEGRYFLNSVQQMVLVVTDNPNEGLRLVTTYPATKQFRQMAKAA